LRTGPGKPGGDAEEIWILSPIIDAHPHLKLEHVHDALSYCYENRGELDENIESGKEFIQRPSEATEIRIRP